MRIGPGGKFSFEAFVGAAVVEPGSPVPCFDLDQHRRQIPVRSRACHQRNVGGALENLLALLLGYTTEDSELLALGL